jgi:hypothetical protein
MTDDPIRDLLAGLPRASRIRTPPGRCAIFRKHVEQRGGDPDAVLQWVEAHGGYAERTEPVVSKGLRVGRRLANAVPGEWFYVIPEDALVT